MTAHAGLRQGSRQLAWPPGSGVRAALFDVDETLVATKTMFDFLAYHLRRTGAGRLEFDRIVEEFAAFAAAGGSRLAGNRRFYRLFTGCDWHELMSEGRDWFADRMAGGRLLHRVALDRLAEHRAAGDTVILVSGSFPPCLQPIAEAVGAAHLLCSRPEVRDGVVTGELAVPMIGENKASAVVRLLAELGVDRADTWAYADHDSDLQMLELAGNPVAVGDHPAVAKYVRGAGGRLLPGIERLPYPDW